MKRRLIPTLVLAASVFWCSIAQSANIIWVSNHPADNQPHANALADGFTQAPDVGYTELLRNAGHSVTRYVTTGTPASSLLNAADLVIISRSVMSVDYEDDLETALWNGITAPTMILDGYLLRSSRLGYTAGTTIPDTAGAVKLQVNNPLHPIFWGIALDSANTTVNTYATSGTTGNIFFNGVPQRGISVNTDPLAGGGTVLATVAAGDPNTSGGMIIGEWQAGALMGTVPADRLGGHRLVFLTGTREADGLFAECAGMYDLTLDGAQLFLLRLV